MRHSRTSVTKEHEYFALPLTLGKRELNRIDKLNRIKKAAATLFEKQGYERTTTLSVARLAGIANGTLFLYARTKEDILELVMASEIDKLVVSLGNSVPEDAPLTEQVWHVFHGLLKYHRQRKELSRFYIRESALPMSSNEPHQRSRSTGRRITNLLERLLIREQAAGRVRRDVVASNMAQTMFWLFYGHLTGLLSARRSSPFPNVCSLLRESLQSYYEGIQAPGAAARSGDPVPRPRRPRRRTRAGD